MDLRLPALLPLQPSPSCHLPTPSLFLSSYNDGKVPRRGIVYCIAKHLNNIYIKSIPTLAPHPSTNIAHITYRIAIL